MSSVGRPASLPNMIEKMIIVMKGRRMAQPAPKRVCLYRTFTSRQMKKYVSSRYCQSSLTLMPIHPLAGRMKVTGCEISDKAVGRAEGSDTTNLPG